jgi:polyhydroxyalkanoate synthesis regulator phasin
MKTTKELMGAHWEQTNYSKLYQLYRRVEDVAHDLETRRQQDMKVTKGLVEELYDIAIKLKVLDGKMIL